MAQVTRNALGSSLVSSLLALHLGLFAGKYRYLGNRPIYVYGYEAKYTVVAFLTVAFLFAELYSPILSKKRYRIFRHGGLFVLGAAQLVVFVLSGAVFHDFAGIFLGISSIALSFILAFKDSTQVFTVVPEEQISLPTYATPSPTQMHVAPPAYNAPAYTSSYMKN